MNLEVFGSEVVNLELMPGTRGRAWDLQAIVPDSHGRKGLRPEKGCRVGGGVGGSSAFSPMSHL